VRGRTVYPLARRRARADEETVTPDPTPAAAHAHEPGRATGLALALVLGAVLLAGAVVSYARLAEPPQRARAATVYAAHDPWEKYLADEATCPGGERTDTALVEQVSVMVCLIDYARAKRGLAPLTPEVLLDHSALAKAGRIVACRDFAHAACGLAPDAEVRAHGYDGAFGENLYIASGVSGAPRPALYGWLNSAGHRRNLFRAEWRLEGIAVETLPRFGPYENATLWVHQLAGQGM